MLGLGLELTLNAGLRSREQDGIQQLIVATEDQKVDRLGQLQALFPSVDCEFVYSAGSGAPNAPTPRNPRPYRPTQRWFETNSEHDWRGTQ